MEGQGGFLIKAVYPFFANKPEELSACEGDIIRVINHIDEHWYDGELNGKQGLFPVTYAEKIEEQLKTSFVIGIENYYGRRPGEISFIKGDYIKVIEEIDSIWCRGEVKGNVGIFPYAFVEKTSCTVSEDDKMDEAIYSNFELYENLDITIAEAFYSFDARNSEELSFPMGAEIVITKDIDSEWYEGTFEGQTGLFPKNYVQLLALPLLEQTSQTSEESSKRPYARSIYPFVGENDSELTFKEGELIYLIKRAGSQWLEGEIGNKVGRFPASFVNIEVDLSPEKDFSKEYSARAQTVPEKVHWTEGLSARALYHFSALNLGDLALNEGDLITVLKVVDDNWLEGRLESGASGTCPLAYLEPVWNSDQPDVFPHKGSMFMELKAGLKARETNEVSNVNNQTWNKPEFRNGDLANLVSRCDKFQNKGRKDERTLLDSSFSEDSSPFLRPVGTAADERMTLRPSLKPRPAPRPPGAKTQQLKNSNVFAGIGTCSNFNPSPRALSPSFPLQSTTQNTTDLGLVSPTSPSRTLSAVPFKSSKNKCTKSPTGLTAQGSVASQSFLTGQNAHGLGRQNQDQCKSSRTTGTSHTGQSLLDTSVATRASVVNLAMPLVPLPPGSCTPHGSCSPSSGGSEDSPIVPRRKAPPPPKKNSPKLVTNDYKSNSLPRSGKSKPVKEWNLGKGNKYADRVDNISSIVPFKSVEDNRRRPAPKTEIPPSSQKKHPPPPPPTRHNKGHFGMLERSATISAATQEKWLQSSPPKDAGRVDNTRETSTRRKQRPYSVYYIGEDNTENDKKLAKSNSMEDVRSSGSNMSSKMFSSQFDLNKDQESTQIQTTSQDDYVVAGIPVVVELDKTIAEAEQNLQVEKRAFSGMKTILQMLIHDPAKYEEMEGKISRSQQKIDEWQEIVGGLKDEKSFMIDSYHKRKKLVEKMVVLESDMEKQVRSQKNLEVLLEVVEESRREEVIDNLTVCKGIIDDINTQMKDMEDSLQNLSQRPTRSTQQHMAEQRKKVVTELITTERDYLRDLQMCVKYFFNVLKNSQVVEADILFGNMKAVLETSSKLLDSFEQVLKIKDDKQQELGKCFVNIAQEMKEVYSTYCRNHDDAIALLEKYEDIPEAQEAFNKCLQEIRDSTKCWDLSSFLIKPVQRVLKYPLLLSELVKYTPEIHKDKHNLIRAMSTMTDVATAINEVKRRKDLVVKYKRVEESGISTKFQKLSWHSVMKKSSRFNQKITQLTGLVSQTVDKRFNEEEKKFSNLEKSVKNLIKNISGYVEQFQETVTQQQGTGENIKEYYHEAATCTEVTLYQCTQYRISGVLLDAFMNEVQCRVLTPLNALLALFQGPQRVIQKRHHKCLDYDSWSNKIDKIKDKEKLKAAKDELQRAKKDYEAMNTQLLEDLPLFHDKTASLIKDCILNFVQAKRTFHAVILGEYTNLMLLELIKDGDSDIIQHQSSRTLKVMDSLAGLSFIPLSFGGKDAIRKRRESKNDPSVPLAPASVEEGYLKPQRRERMESLSRKRMAPPPPMSITSASRSQKSEPPKPVPRRQMSDTMIKAQPNTKLVGVTPADSRLYIVIGKFDAQNMGEISVNEGDAVTVLRQCDTSGNPEWWLVSCSGSTGYVPSDFIKPCDDNDVDDKGEDEDEGIDNGSDDISDDTDDVKLEKHVTPIINGKSKTEPYMAYYAQFEFEGTSDAELSIDEGQVVSVLQQHDLEGNSEWWLVETEGKKGYVAATFLAPVEDEGS